MTYEALLLEHQEHVAIVTLNRPRVLNALNAALLQELDEALQSLAGDSAVRVIVLRGAGGKAFAAGADIAELADADPVAGEALARRVQGIFARIGTLGKPIIACIDGYALGGGCELAMACTLRLANDAARLGQPEIKLGLIPGYGGSQRPPRLVGQGAALKMLLTGGMVDAAEAWRIGLVDEVVHGDSEALLQRAVELAQAIAAMSPIAVSAAMEAVRVGANLPLNEAVEVEASIFGRLCGTEDKREGTRAFLEKRAPVWTGR